MKNFSTSTSFYSIISMFWPQIITLYLYSLINIAPIWVSGQINADSQASIGVILQCILFFNVITNAISSGASVIITQSIGAKKFLRMRYTFNFVLVLNFFCGLVIGWLIYIFKDLIFACLNLRDEVLFLVDSSWIYVAFCVPFVYVLFYACAIFRALRQMIYALYMVIIASFLQILFLYLFSFVETEPFKAHQGVTLAYLFAEIVAALMATVFVFFINKIKFKMPKFRWIYYIFRYMIKTILSVGATSFIIQGSFLAVFAVLAAIPIDQADAIAGYSTGRRIESSIFACSVAFAVIAQIMSGNCMGEQKPQKAKKICIKLTFFTFLLMSFIALFAWIFINEIADFFCSEVGAKNYAISYLKYNFLSLPFLSICVIFAATLIGAGAAYLNFICCAISLWVFELPCAMILSKILNDANAIFIAILTAKIAEMMMLVWIFFNVKFEKYAMKS